MSALDSLYQIGHWSMDAFWLPMLVWTVVALPVFVIQRWTPGVSFHTRYWTVLGLLAALPIGLLAGAFVTLSDGSARDVVAIVNLPAFEPSVESTSASPALAWSTFHSAGLLVAVAGMFALVRGVGLAKAALALRRLARSETASPPRSVARTASVLAEHFGITRDIRIAMSDAQPSPLTFGWRTPVVLVPTKLIDAPTDLRLALAHEFVHIQRGDYQRQWCEHLIGALFFVHPLVALLRREASILREITCDADVLAQFGERARYARLLFQYSTGNAHDGQLAIGILLQENHLKTRIRAMKNLLDLTRLTRSKRIGLAVSAALLTLTVVAVACTDAFVDSTSTEAPRAAEHAGTLGDGDGDNVYVVVEHMPELVGGLASITQNLRYPEMAKEAGVSGRVIVQFVVNEDGEVVNPKVVRGVGSGLDEAALDAVRRAEFKPGIQRGEPVPVKMSLPVTFKLGEAEADGGTGTIDGIKPAEEVDQLPEIVGGLQSLQKDLRYPAVAKRAGIEGRVIVEFVVTEEGSTSDARVVAGLGSGLDEEALRAVQDARFTPARKDGRPVEMKLTLPITFRLSSDRTPTPPVVQVEVRSNGEIFLDGTRTELAHLAAALGDLVEDDTIVSMRVARDAPAALVRRAQEELRKSSARKIDYKAARP